MLNSVKLIGNLGADPEIRSTNTGDRVTNLRIATQETWRDRASGERRSKTEWHRVTVWGDGSANYLEYAKKGTLIFIEGKLETRKWVDNGGQERYSTEIVVKYQAGGKTKILSGGVEREEEPAPPQAKPRGRGAKKAAASQREDFSADLDDEIPF